MKKICITAFLALFINSSINANEITRYANDPILFDVINKLGKENIQYVTDYVKDNVQINKYYSQ